HLAGCDLYRADGLADLAVAGDVVRAGRLLDEEGVGEGQLVDPVDRLVHLPDLVGVDHQVTIRADDFTGDGEAADIVLEVAADLHLNVVEAGIDRLLAEAAQLVFGIAEPAGRGRVAGIAFLPEGGDALRLAGFGLLQNGNGLVTGQYVGKVAEVDNVGDLFRREFGHQLPDGLALLLGQKVPEGV